MLITQLVSNIFSFFIGAFSILLNHCSILTQCDAATDWQLGLQEPASPSAEGIIFFHDYLMFFMIAICGVVFFLLYIILGFFFEEKKKRAEVFAHSSVLEIVWTIIPAIILLFLAVPSFALLYSLDEVVNPDVTLKIVGHQWYWSYEYSDYSSSFDGKSVSFDSYMIPTNELTPGAFRLLEVDNRVILPIATHIRLLVTAADVLHSWAVPSFGLKIDACPGRLTQASLYIKREGLFFGQCSEICGINHGFMPIAVKGVTSDIFTNWIAAKLENE